MMALAAREDRSLHGHMGRFWQECKDPKKRNQASRDGMGWETAGPEGRRLTGCMSQRGCRCVSSQGLDVVGPSSGEEREAKRSG